MRGRRYSIISTVTKGPRDYSSGTRAALFHLARGTCFFPDCDVTVISQVGDHHIVGVEIAHIHGANEGSARYVESMTDEERAAFENLILLCTAHHKLVDRLAPGEYPAEVLRGWKEMSEPQGAEQSVGAKIDFSNIETLLQQVADSMIAERRIEVDLLGGVLMNRSECVAFPLAEAITIFAFNAHLRGMPRVIVASIRNIGTVAASVEAVDIHYSMLAPGASTGGTFSLLGRNDFPYNNPRLPYRLEDGASLDWHMRHETVEQVDSAHPNLQVGEIWVRVRLGSGDLVESAHEPWPRLGGSDPILADGDA